MDDIDLNFFLNRKDLEVKISNLLDSLKIDKNNKLTSRGIYIYGNPGSGKTYFIKKLLQKYNFDEIYYDAGDIRNKNILDNINNHNISDTNVLSLMHNKKKQIVIVMDEIDGMNNGDKGGLNSLIRIIRPKKTKKQKSESCTSNPIICISNYHIDKKIKELMRVCYSFELKSPTTEQIKDILKFKFPNLSEEIIITMINFVQNDLRKLSYLIDIYNNKSEKLDYEIIFNLFKYKNLSESSKEITGKLINNSIKFEQHNNLICDTDRTIVGLLWHENIIDIFTKLELNDKITLYLKLLDNICYSDYIDRITFQKQIWQFNEMSILIKVFYNNYICYNLFSDNKLFNKINEIRFTKVLTKYSTEYNNSLFIQYLCQLLNLEKSDLISLFLLYKEEFNDEEIYEKLNIEEISKLDINRFCKFIEVYS